MTDRLLPRRKRICRWCSRNLGVVNGWVFLCPGCDYNEIGGPPCEDRVKDQEPKP